LFRVHKVFHLWDRQDRRAGEFSLAANAVRIDKRLYVGGNESGDSPNLDVRDLAVRRFVI
jgi:hypothetical protein